MKEEQSIRQHFLPYGAQCNWPGNGSPRECQTQSTGPCSQTLQTRSKKYYRETRGCELVLTLQLHLPTKVSREDLGMNRTATILSISTGKESGQLEWGDDNNEQGLPHYLPILTVLRSVVVENI